MTAIPISTRWKPISSAGSAIGLMYQISYTWSHNMADYVDNLTGACAPPQNAYDYAHEMSYSAQDVRNRFVGSGTWELPIGQGGWVMNSDS